MTTQDAKPTLLANAIVQDIRETGCVALKVWGDSSLAYALEAIEKAQLRLEGKLTCEKVSVDQPANGDDQSSERLAAFHLICEYPILTEVSHEGEN